MTVELLNTLEVKDLLNKVSGLTNDTGDARLKRIVHRVVSDLFRTIEDFEGTAGVPYQALLLSSPGHHADRRPRGCEHHR